MSRPEVQRRSIIVFALTAMAWLVPGETSAQAMWLRGPLERGTTIEVDKVAFSEDQGLSTFSLAFYFETRLPLRPDLQLVGEFPFTTAKFNGSPFSTQAIGNAYVGVEWEHTDLVVWEFGARIPLSDNPVVNGAAALGLASDAADRLEAWADRAVSFQLAPNLVHRGRDGLVLRLRGGPSLFLPTGNGSLGTELILAYGGQIGFEGDLVQLLGGVSGRVVTGSEGEAFNHAVARIAFELGGFRPAAFLRIPFGDLDGVDVVYGIGLSFGS